MKACKNCKDMADKIKELDKIIDTLEAESIDESNLTIRVHGRRMTEIKHLQAQLKTLKTNAVTETIYRQNQLKRIKELEGEVKAKTEALEKKLEPCPFCGDKAESDFGFKHNLDG